MAPTRRTVLAAVLALGAARRPGIARPVDGDADAALRTLIHPHSGDVPEAIRTLTRLDSLATVPGLILALRYSPLPGRAISDLLAAITGEPASDGWFHWMLWQERHPEVLPTPGYIDLKRGIYLAIDPAFAPFLRPEFLTREAARIRFEEVAWGGVRKDGIPSLDHPAHIPAEAADYLRRDDPVFGVSIGGDARAYPLRIMGWHEMFNEVIGGVPLSLAYCTLCGAGILYETAVPGRPQPFVFGSSGFLYRSNKLMFDRQTHTLWNQFAGRPVIGPLAASGIELRQRPVAIEPWGTWRRRNPHTTVLSLDTGHRRDYDPGVVYRDYFASPELMFPAVTAPSPLASKDFVFGIRTFGAAKAWPIRAFAHRPVINDRVGDLPVVLLGDAAGRTVRAYERGQRRFTRGANAKTLRNPSGTWRITEEALLGPGGERLPRVAGHVAYWFAWNGAHDLEAELYEG